MKPTDRIFQQTNDTSDGSFFDEYIDNLYVFDDFCKQIKRYNILTCKNDVFLKSLILYGIIGIILHLWFNVFHTLKHWFSMGLLRKNDAFGFSIFHDVIFLNSLTIYGIAGKMLHLVSMFSTILHPSNDWMAMGWLGKHCMWFLLIAHPNAWKSYSC